MPDHRGDETPLAVGMARDPLDAVAPTATPAPDAGRAADSPTPPDVSSDQGATATMTWAALVLGALLVGVAGVGLVLRPASSPAPLPVPSPVAANAPTALPSQRTIVAAGPRQTVTVWTLPEGVWTWWPIADRVVFVTGDPGGPADSVRAYDKVSGQPVWSRALPAGQEVVVRDPDGQDSLRFVMPDRSGDLGPANPVPGDPGPRDAATGGDDGGGRDGTVTPPVDAVPDGVVTLSLDDGAVLRDAGPRGAGPGDDD